MSYAEFEYHPKGWIRLFYLLNRPVYKGYKPIIYRRDVPEKWNHLNKAQLLIIAKSRFLISHELAKKAYLAFKLFKIPCWVLDDMEVKHLNIIHDHISQLLGDCTLTKTIIKKLRVGVTTLLGPADGGSNLVLLEFLRADKHYNAFLKTGKLEHLNQLIAVLYRKKRKDLTVKDIAYDGDLRVEYNDYHLAGNVKRIKWVPLVYRFAILYQYMGFRKALEKKFPLTFSQQGKGKSFGDAGLIVSLSGGKFGTESQVVKTKLMPILTELEMSNYNYNELKE